MKFLKSQNSTYKHLWTFVKPGSYVCLCEATKLAFCKVHTLWYSEEWLQVQHITCSMTRGIGVSGTGGGSTRSFPSLGRRRVSLRMVPCPPALPHQVVIFRTLTRGIPSRRATPPRCGTPSTPTSVAIGNIWPVDLEYRGKSYQWFQVIVCTA